MNIDNFQKARKLIQDIEAIQVEVDNLSEDYRNYYQLPEEIFKRHRAEIESFLEGEIKRLQAEFDSL